jgi:hypothetical protein
MKRTLLSTLLLAASCAAFAQAPRESDRRPEGAAPIQRSQCDLLAGVEHERCIAEEKSAREQLGRSEAPKKSCDELFGPEKELCLKKGGSVKTGGAASGSSR